jgi:hypothetical protein
MADRMDIDALLIGSLYGELTPADQARLQAHLESHPADRSVLADLTRARQVIRESRLFELQFEPPQAVSALLLQEAARRAPRVRVTKANAERGESWFQRFIRSLAAHPAMAAAAMLVVVLGATAIMYKRNGAQNWEPRAEETEQAAPATAPVAEGKAQKDNYAVDLANEEKLQQRQQAQQTVDAGALAAPASTARPGDSPAEPAAKPPAKVADPAPRKEPPRGIAVEGSRPEPKDLEDDAKAKTGFRGNKETQATESRLDVKSPSGPSGRVVGSNTTPGAPHTGGAGSAAPTETNFNGDSTTGIAGPSAGNAGGTGGAGAPAAPANRKLETTKDARRPAAPSPAPASTAAPPPPPPPAPAQQPASREKTVQKGADKADKNDADKPAEDLTYARGQHQKIIAAVKANRCMEATNLAFALENRAPAYYAQNVENDRAIKSCASYIANERAKRVEAEKRARAKASERRVDEAPKATAPTTEK